MYVIEMAPLSFGTIRYLFYGPFFKKKTYMKKDVYGKHWMSADGLAL